MNPRKKRTVNCFATAVTGLILAPRMLRDDIYNLGPEERLMHSRSTWALGPPEDYVLVQAQSFFERSPTGSAKNAVSGVIKFAAAVSVEYVNRSKSVNNVREESGFDEERCKTHTTQRRRHKSRTLLQRCVRR
jgi:hypothetical protein